MHRIRREAASVTELPIAQLLAQNANIHRDSKKRPQPFSPLDFCLFREEPQSDAPFSAEVAAIALELRHQEQSPPMLLTVWPQVLASVKEGVSVPKVRAFRSKGGEVWILAPSWEGANCRGGLVLVRGQISGRMVVFDLDRPLISYSLNVPERKGYGWIEAGLLLAGES